MTKIPFKYVVIFVLFSLCMGALVYLVQPSSKENVNYIDCAHGTVLQPDGSCTPQEQ